MKTPNVTCLFCKKQVYVSNYRIETFKYCCRSCKDKSNSMWMTTNCFVCGNEFSHKSCRCMKAKYCSRQCYYKAQHKNNKGTQDYTCLHCGIIFKDSPCMDRKYCSKACTGKDFKDRWEPKYTTIRKKMINEDLVNKCEKCGYDEFKEILGIHHIDKNRNNNKKENIQVLCPMCHSLAHMKHIAHCPDQA